MLSLLNTIMTWNNEWLFLLAIVAIWGVFAGAYFKLVKQSEKTFKSRKPEIKETNLDS